MVLHVAWRGGDGSGGGPSPSELADWARQLLQGALAAPLRDDRFDGDWPPDDLVAAVALADGRPVGYLGGSIDRGRFQLSGLIDEGTPVQVDVEVGIEVEPAVGGWPEAAADEPGDGRSSEADELADRLLTALLPRIEASGADTVELWGNPARPWHRRLAERNGLVEARALHQLRCRLPVDVGVEPVESRPFRPGHDEDALIRVNNRAFAAHPDQGGMTRERIAAAAAEPWFDPEGIRLLDDPDRPGALAGFCWTKIHQPTAAGEPALGEIYAIGIDPDHHGRGLGAPMTAAGLAWLAEQGLTTGMLYVEADNEPALRTYHRLGYRHHRTDRAWRRSLGP